MPKKRILKEIFGNNFMENKDFKKELTVENFHNNRNNLIII